MVRPNPTGSNSMGAWPTNVVLGGTISTLFPDALFRKASVSNDVNLANRSAARYFKQVQE